MEIDVLQLEFIDKQLRNILVWLEKQTGFKVTITSLYRIGDSGVHGVMPLRGLDLRMRGKWAGQVMEDIINRSWLYDPERPTKKCAKLHGDGANLHLHLQVHPNTINVSG